MFTIVFKLAFTCLPNMFYGVACSTCRRRRPLACPTCFMNFKPARVSGACVWILRAELYHSLSSLLRMVQEIFECTSQCCTHFWVGHAYSIHCVEWAKSGDLHTIQSGWHMNRNTCGSPLHKAMQSCTSIISTQALLTYSNTIHGPYTCCSSWIAWNALPSRSFICEWSLILRVWLNWVFPTSYSLIAKAGRG